MAPLSTDPRRIPDWLRWTALLWLIFWFTLYWRVWGATNFLHLCDVALILTCIGLWTNNTLLISSQAIASLVIDLSWCLDAAWNLIFGRHLIGGTEYLFDPKYPLWIRLISLFHVVLPVLLLWAVHRTGYDRRGWAVQSVIMSLVILASRFTPPVENYNYAFRDPFRNHAFQPAALHVALCILFINIVFYLPAHLLLRWLFPKPPSA